jgi:dehydrogenase/reductase SDR family member 7B
MKLQGKKVWITGAGSGIGEAMARQLSGVASVIIISALEEYDLKRVAHEIACEQTHIEVLPFDLADSTQIELAGQHVLRKFGGVDVLINNGGISQRSLVMDATDAVERKIMEINFFSYVHLTRLMLPAMVQQGKGHIAVTSSMVGKFGFPLRSTYAASKHAVEGYFETLGLEMVKKGIRVTIASPGRIRTNISFNAVLASGQKHGMLDPGQAGGMSAVKCAQKYLRAIEKDRWETYIGHSELLMIWIKRYFPPLFRRIAMNIKDK